MTWRGLCFVSLQPAIVIIWTTPHATGSTASVRREKNGVIDLIYKETFSQRPASDRVSPDACTPLR
jgi:hypothetical protein